MIRKKIICWVLLVALSAVSLSAQENPRCNALKMTFLSWASGSTKISYERALPDLAQSGEVCVGLISAGYDKYHNHPRGFTLRYGHKFFLGDYSPARPFDGFYLRPELIYSRFHYDAQESGARRLANMGAIIATAGYQHTFGRLVVDGWVGGGYALGEPADTGYHHGFVLLDHFGLHSDHVALSFSIRVGWCF